MALRYLTISFVFLMGCASTARITATGGEGRPVFQIASWWRPVKVLGIIVHEIEDGRPSRAVCRLNRISMKGADIIEMERWEYGVSVGPNYQAQDCQMLQVGREYSIAVMHIALCGSGTRFRLGADGSVEDLGPH